MSSKKCQRCDTVKPVDGFGRRKASSDGLHPWCRPCKLEYERNYRRSKPQIIAAKNKRYRETEKQRHLEALEFIRGSRG